MTSVSGVLRKSGHDIYENMIPVIALSFLWFVLLSPALFLLALPFAIPYLILTAVPGLAGVLYAMRHKIDRQPFSYWLFFKGLRKFYWRSLIYGLFLSIFVFIFIASWWYALQNATLFTYVVAIFQSYFFLFVLLALLYTLPILVCKDQKITRSMHESLILFLSKGLFTIGTFVQIITVGVLLIVTVVSVPLLFAGMLSIFFINTYKSFVKKENEKEKETYQLSFLNK